MTWDNVGFRGTGGMDRGVGKTRVNDGNVEYQILVSMLRSNVVGYTSDRGNTRDTVLQYCTDTLYTKCTNTTYPWKSMEVHGTG